MKKVNIKLLVLAVTFAFSICAAGQLKAEDPQVSSPAIVINYIPPIGEGGVAEGRVIWNDLGSVNVEQFAVIAMLRSSWGSDYVKPYNNNYLNAIDTQGNFSINITTGGESDFTITNVSFYFVRKETFEGIDGSAVNAGYMEGKYIGESLTVNRDDFWANRPQAPVPDIRPGLADAGQSITLSCGEGGGIFYTEDGSDPAVSASAKEYIEGVTSFTVPAVGSLLIKAVTRASNSFSSVASLVWLPREPVSTPFWGLNVSLALNDEYFGYNFSEEKTRERMEPVARITKWIRTFGTLNNGHPYINKIAKENGLRTMIGVYVTGNESDNNAQIEGLRQILIAGPAPDLIAVGNECSLSGVAPATLIACIDAVREVVKNAGLVIPVGSVDIANISWNRTLLDRLDFIGVNIYCGTWDETPENEMVDALIKTYESQIAAFPSKFVLLTETGTPYSGGSYIVGNGYTQTPSPQKAANYLSGFLEWIARDRVPSFFFEAYDEPVKSRNGGHPIEQYFGLMDGNLEIHSFYSDIITDISPVVSVDSAPYPNPVADSFRIDGIVAPTEVTVTDLSGNAVLTLTVDAGEPVAVGHLQAGVYLVRVNGKTVKVVKR
ncbi:MAG: T9SS type A sorting domain-containing protein [Dysgonamonadaceae bacterium]|jgi:exo-beta-1,3-glucanase (GH17 family)|nr:T9SS type A sorting domain-containing protein [Dysgonamonadaceae bacterium]